MQTVINIILILVFIILLIMAIILLIDNYVCDNQNCKPFIEAFEHKTTKERLLYLLDVLCEDGMWPIGFIASGILTGLLFAVLPLMVTVKLFTLVFLISFLVFYSIMAFFIHHYVKPIKKYIIDYIEKNVD